MLYTPAKHYSAITRLRSLSKQLRGLTKAQRAVWVAGVQTGTVVLEGPPSQKQLCALAGISVPYVQAARKLTRDQRTAVWLGVRPLREATSPSSAEVRFHEAINDLGLARAFELFVAAEAKATATSSSNGNGPTDDDDDDDDDVDTHIVSETALAAAWKAEVLR
jgi:hypothetical protein